MIEKVEFCSAEIIVNWCSPIRLLSIQNQVENGLKHPISAATLLPLLHFFECGSKTCLKSLVY